MIKLMAKNVVQVQNFPQIVFVMGCYNRELNFKFALSGHYLLFGNQNMINLIKKIMNCLESHLVLLAWPPWSRRKRERRGIK